MNLEPNHQSVCSRLGKLCTKSIEDVKKALTAQQEADAAATRLHEEEERAKKEWERMAAEQAEKEKVERARKMEEECNGCNQEHSTQLVHRDVTQVANRSTVPSWYTGVLYK